MEPNRENIEDLKRRYWYTDNEAEAYYYLNQARERFTKMYEDDDAERPDDPLGLSRMWGEMFVMSTVQPHFQALTGMLAKMVLQRDYPEGWGEGWRARLGNDEDRPPE